MSESGKKKSLTEQCAAYAVAPEEPPWPGEATLYQPYEWEQILLPEHASCLAVRAYLAMAGVRVTIAHRANAEAMSPTGRVPFLRTGSYLVAGLEPIVSFVTARGRAPPNTNTLDSAQRADLRAFLSLVLSVFGSAESFVTWLDEPTYSSMTRARYGAFQPAPLGWILAWRRRKTEKAKLSGWADGGLPRVLGEVARACRALTSRLGSGPFFFGQFPTELDAALFGHIYALATWRGTEAGTQLAETVRAHPTLLEVAARIAPLLGLPTSPLVSTVPEKSLSAPPVEDPH